MKINKGFTLIELLVAIVIVAILSAIAFTSFSSAQKSARDARRRSDLEQYRNALQSYAANNGGKYPYNNCGASGIDSCVGSTFSPQTGLFATGPLIPKYLPTVILDPINQLRNGKNYRYFYYDNNGGGLEWKIFAENLEAGGVWEICSNGKTGTPATIATNTYECDL